jgi:8-oxo-dGTP pyrophosphatase MutT (NUDIX family)
LLDLEGAGGVLVRWFNYRDEQRGALRAYTLLRAPMGRVEGTIFPFQRGRPCGLASGIGLRFGYERMETVTSVLAARRLATNETAYDAALVLRIALGALNIVPSAGYFGRRYTVDGGVVPNVDYRSVGGRLDAELRMGDLLFEAGAGGRWLLQSGELGSAAWFPAATAFAVVGRARAGVVITDWLDLLASASAEYFSFHFNIVPGGTYPNGVAAGAYDIYLQGLLSLRFHVSGSAKGQ